MLGSLKVRNYRLFATGQVISLIGTWMQFIAQDWLVLQLTDNSGTARNENLHSYPLRSRATARPLRAGQWRGAV